MAKLEVPGPTGPRLTLLARDHRLLASFPHDRAYWEGEATAQALEVVLGVGLTPSEVMDLLVGLDYPDGMTSGLRRTTDVARALVERSRSDLTATVVQERLRQDLARRPS